MQHVRRMIERMVSCLKDMAIPLRYTARALGPPNFKDLYGWGMFPEALIIEHGAVRDVDPKAKKKPTLPKTVGFWPINSAFLLFGQSDGFREAPTFDAPSEGRVFRSCSFCGRPKGLRNSELTPKFSFSKRETPETTQKIKSSHNFGAERGFGASS